MYRAVIKFDVLCRSEGALVNNFTSIFMTQCNPARVRVGCHKIIPRTDFSVFCQYKHRVGNKPKRGLSLNNKNERTYNNSGHLMLL